ncbi:AMP-binding protein, partial [Alcaligenes nematophilus]|uniref:AMP-binding protein n=1 Tax=Alcaligenes nematophilus TaxID=2994643 RepID=UPI003D1EFEAC
MNKVKRIFDILEHYKEQHKSSCIVAGKKDGVWVKYSSEEFLSHIDNLSKALIAKGVQKGDRIALMSGNRPEWNIVEYACNQLGVAIV